MKIIRNEFLIDFWGSTLVFELGVKVMIISIKSINNDFKVLENINACILVIVYANLKRVHEV